MFSGSRTSSAGQDIKTDYVCNLYGRDHGSIQARSRRVLNHQCVIVAKAILAQDVVVVVALTALRTKPPRGALAVERATRVVDAELSRGEASDILK